MGWNTGVIILNDAVHAIENNPDEFVNGRRGLSAAMSQFMAGRNERKFIDIGVGGHVNAASVFHQQHADSVGVYALGGNYASELGSLHWGNQGHHEDEQKVKLLERIADQLGYKLVPK